MPKIKTHKRTKKVMKVKSSGFVSRRKAGGNHKTGKKRGKFNRNIRKTIKVSSSDLKRLKDLLK